MSWTLVMPKPVVKAAFEAAVRDLPESVATAAKPELQKHVKTAKESAAFMSREIDSPYIYASLGGHLHSPEVKDAQSYISVSVYGIDESTYQNHWNKQDSK